MFKRQVQVDLYYFSLIKNDNEKIKKTQGKREKINDNKGKPCKYKDEALKKPNIKSTS